MQIYTMTNISKKEWFKKAPGVTYDPKKGNWKGNRGNKIRLKVHWGGCLITYEEMCLMRKVSTLMNINERILRSA